MKRKCRFFTIFNLYFLLSVSSLYAADTLTVRDASDSIRVSLVTCSPGTEVYEVYGHTAIRYEVPSQGIDYAFNYGLFSFDTPHFIRRFVRGETDYTVGGIDFAMFAQEYTGRGSDVMVQELNLTQEEKKTFAQLITTNLQRQNRVYRYNFLYNNCSTKARDKIVEAVDGDVIYVDSDSVISFRDIIHESTANYPWMQFGIDILLGYEADRSIDAMYQMFAPLYLHRYTSTAKVKDASGMEAPWTVRSYTLPAQTALDVPASFPLTPMQMMLLLLLLTGLWSAIEFMHERLLWGYDIFLYTLQGLVGCVVAYLFFFSEHPTVDSNVLVAFLNPIPLLLLPVVLYLEVRRKSVALYAVELVMLVAFVIAVAVTRQQVQPAMYMFAFILLYRTLHHFVLSCYKKKCMSRHASSRERTSCFTRSLCLLILLLPSTWLMAQHKKDPQLVIGIVVDQLRSDYIEKFAPLYGDDGFRKLWSEGRVFTNGYFDYVGIDRASATASVYTGTVPYYHGITGNTFFERKSLKVKECVDDNGYIGIHTEQRSAPSQLMVTSLTDELKIATGGHANIVSIAPERDVAVLSGGHAANVVAWIDDAKGVWGSSSYYGETPKWLFDSKWRKHSKFAWNAMQWEPYYPVARYSTAINNEKLHTFCHTYSQDDVLKYKTSALVNDEVTALAKKCISEKKFGRDNITDMLCLGYYAGNYEHAPEWKNQLEMQDIYCRLDRNIADLIHEVDEKIGLENVVFFLTSTGYSETYRPYDNYFSLPTGDLYMSRCEALLNMYLGALYGSGNYVEGYYLNEMYLNHNLIEEKQLALQDIMTRSSDFLCQMSGVKRVHSSLGLLSSSGDVMMRNAYNSNRSGDLILEVAPGWMLIDEQWKKEYYSDRSQVPVPIIFFGDGLRPQISHTPVSADVIAPTMAHLLKISAPNGCSARPVDGL